MSLPPPPPDPAGVALLARLRAGDQQPLEELYRTHRTPFLHWAARRFTDCPPDELHDVFQDAVIAFYENVVSGRLQALTATVRTYLFQIAEHLLMAQARKKKLALPINNWGGTDIEGVEADDTPGPMTASLLDSFHFEDPHAEAGEPWLEAVQRGLRMLSPDCRELLVGYYYRNQPFEALRAAFSHGNERITRVRKSQCLARLRDLCRNLLA